MVLLREKTKKISRSKKKKGDKETWKNAKLYFLGRLKEGKKGVSSNNRKK